MAYRGTPWVDEAKKKTMKVNLTHIPLKLHQNLGEVIKDAMQPYGEILQIRKYTNSFGRFFGEASVILNRDEETHKDYAILSRMIYLESQDLEIPATYQGAPKICFHCRLAGHVRKDCRELAAIQCYRYQCKGFGHQRRHCRKQRAENVFG